MSAIPIKRKRRSEPLVPADGQLPRTSPSIENSEAVPSAPPIDTNNSPSLEPQHQTAHDLYRQFYTLITQENPLSKLRELRTLVSKLLQAALASVKGTDKYNWLVIHDNLVMTRPDADKIYKAISKFTEKREIGLILTSGGGQIEPAYLISKLCRESTSGKFVAVVPRRAKSAATLIACGADEIHMGQMSELGPIDPQIENLPVLGLKSAVQHLAELACQYPKASEMLSKYLSASLQLDNLGYYERVAESAVQYADRLLKKRISSLKSDSKEVAKHLVYGYMDHGFVIDRMEAESIFGPTMIKTATPEYDLGNTIYDWLSLIERACETSGYSFYLYGAIDSECNFIKKSK